MALLAPLFLLGLLAIAVPLWLHRMSQDDPKRRQFGSTKFLERVQQQTSTRRSLKYLLLLAARIGLLLLLALLFAQPVIQSRTDVPLGSVARHHLIVIDQSMSMAAGNRWQEAVSAVGDVIDGLPNTDVAQLISASSTLTVLNSPSSDRGELRQILNTLEPSEQRLDYGEMMSSLDSFAESIELGVSLHLVTDAQESSLPLSFAELSPTQFEELELINVADSDRSADETNFGLFAYLENRDQLVISIHRYSSQAALIDAPQAELSVTINDEEFLQRSVNLDLSLTRVEVDLPALPQGDSRIELALSSSDALAIDDRFHLIVNRPETLNVVLFSSSGDRRDTLYLEAALNAQQDREFAITELDANSGDDYLLSDYDLVIASDIGALSQRNIDRLQEYLNSGGRVFATLGRRSSELSEIPLSDLALTSGSSLNLPDSEPLRVSQIDSNHPALQELPVWREARIEQMVQLAEPDSVTSLITLSDGAPLLIEQELPRGLLLILTSGIDNSGNNLPITAGFVPFIGGLVDHLSGRSSLNQQLITGGSLILQQRDQSVGQVLDPQGNSMLSLSDAGSRSSLPLENAGIYQVQTDRSNYLVAVNVDSRESAIMPLDSDQVERWTLLPTRSTNQDSTAVGDERLETFELWPMVLAAFLLLLIGESIYANRHLNIRREAA